MTYRTFKKGDKVLIKDTGVTGTVYITGDFCCWVVYGKEGRGEVVDYDDLTLQTKRLGTLTEGIIL